MISARLTETSWSSSRCDRTMQPACLWTNLDAIHGPVLCSGGIFKDHPEICQFERVGRVDACSIGTSACWYWRRVCDGAQWEDHNYLSGRESRSQA